MKLRVQRIKLWMPSGVAEGFEEEWATHQRWQTILTVVREMSAQVASETESALRVDITAHSKVS